MKRLICTAWLPSVVLVAVMLPTTAFAQSAGQTGQSGQLTEQSLGNLLRAMGLKPKIEQKRYDFRFKAVLDGNEWELSMSAVLSNDKKSIWVMAWLDELPKSASDVPRTALLRLLADNDRLGEGKFFAYIAANRRFVLQRVMPNTNVSTASFRDVLKDLGKTVVITYPHWSVANWTDSSNKSPAANTASGSENKQPRRTTLQDSKFSPVRRN